MAGLFELSPDAELSVSAKVAPSRPENVVNIDEILNPSGRPRVESMTLTPMTFAPPGSRLFPPPPPAFPMMYNPLYHQQQMMYMGMLGGAKAFLTE